MLRPTPMIPWTGGGAFTGTQMARFDLPHAESGREGRR
jgi:hypothetical protein